MDGDALVRAVQTLARELTRLREDDQEWKFAMLEATKAQLGAVQTMACDMAMAAQSLRECEAHLKELADRLAPPSYDD